MLYVRRVCTSTNVETDHQVVMVKSIIVSTYITVALPLFPHVEPQPPQVELTCANNDGDYLDSDGMRVSNG